MAALNDHLDRLRAKPHHVRRQIAFGSSLAVTALVAVGWLGALASSPKLALDARPDDTGNALTQTRTNFSDLMGAAGAALGATSSPAAITVVDTKTSSTLEIARENYNDTNETVIAF